MREFFQEKFTSAEVDFFNPLQNVTVGGGVNTELVSQTAHQLGEVVGLALRGVSSCPMELNLRPPSVIRAERANAQVPFLAIAGVAILAALGAVSFYFDKATTVVKEQTATLQSKASDLSPVRDRIESNRTALKAKQEEILPLIEVVRERDYWVSVLNELNTMLPKEFMWVTGMRTIVEAPPEEPTPGPGKKKAQAAPKLITKLELTGLYLGRAAENPKSAGVLDDFLLNLKGSQFGMAPEEGEQITREAETDAKFAFDWKFPFTLKNPIKIK
jgi:type IV pilus assembly protein PilM